MLDDVEAWPFLVGRGRHVGYRTLLAPGPVLANREQSAISRAVRRPTSGGVSVTTVDTASLGRLTVVYQSRRVANPSSAAGSAVPVYDEHGRPIEILYGFVLPAAELGDVHPADLARAEHSAMAVMARFLDDEESAEPQAASPFTMQTTTFATDEPSPSEPPVPPPAPKPRRRRFPALVPVAVVGLLLIAAALVSLRNGAPAVEVVGGCDAATPAEPSCVLVLVSRAEDSLAIEIAVSPEGAWSVETACPARLDPGVECDVVVTATRSIDGADEGLLTVCHDGSGSPVEVPLRYSSPREPGPLEGGDQEG